MKKLLLVLSLIWGIANFSTAWADCISDHPPAGHFVAGLVLVKMQHGSDRGAAMRAVHASEKSRIHLGNQITIEVWQVPDTMEAVAKLSKRGDVVYAEPDYDGFNLDSTVPNDPLFAKYQWWGNAPTTTCGSSGAVALCGVSCPIPSSVDIGLEEAWDITTGSKNVLVADWEGEPDYSHPDRLAAWYTNPGENCGSQDPTIVCAQRTDGVDNDNDGFVDDVHGMNFGYTPPRPFTGVGTSSSGHATAVAGMIGGGGNNGFGGVGVNWNVSIASFGLSGDSVNMLNSLNYWTARGLRVVNGSFGAGATPQQVVQDAICGAGSPGNSVIWSFSAGNDGVDLDDGIHGQYPCQYSKVCPNVICSGASNCTNIWYSGPSNFNYGHTSVFGVAPGVGIYTDAGPLSPGPCLPAGRNASGCAVNCDGCQAGAGCVSNDDPTPATICTSPTTFQNGTSFSSPTTAGVAALILSIQPTWTPPQVIAAIMENVDKGSPGCTVGTAGCYTGKYITEGKINAFKAVQAANPLALLPTFDSTPNGYTVVPTGTAHFADVDELVQNGDQDYLKVLLNGSEAFGFDASSIPDTMHIKSISLIWTVKNGSVNDAIEHVGMKIGATDYWAADQYIYHNTGYQTFTQTLTAAQLGLPAGDIPKSALVGAAIRHAPVSQGALPRPQLTQLFLRVNP